MHLILDTSNPLEFLEYVGRVAHNSDSKGKDPVFLLARLAQLGHFSVFEHLWLCGREMMPMYTLGEVGPNIFFHHPFKWEHKGCRPYVSMANARELIEASKHEDDDNYFVNIRKLEEYYHNSIDYAHPWFKFASVQIECSVACARQFHRHRWPWSYVEQSLRHTVPDDYIVPNLSYVGSDILDPYFFDEAIGSSFQDYTYLLSCGAHKEDARGLLPLATKTRFIATSPLCGWNSLFSQRAIRTKSNYPQTEIYELANDIMKDLQFIYGNDLVKPQAISFK